MPDIITLTPKQSRRVNSLIKKMCCNFDDGHCILLDDGETCVCPQLITFSHIICKYFKRSVLPIDKDLYIELTKPKNSKKCSVCGKEYLPKGNKSKYCPNCKIYVRRRKQVQYQQKYIKNKSKD